jgi:hypothetical protein
MRRRMMRSEEEPFPGAEVCTRRNQGAALSPLLAVTNVPVMLARLIARSVEAFGGSFTVSRRGPSAGICAPASACPLESVIDCSTRDLAALAPARQSEVGTRITYSGK